VDRSINDVPFGRGHIETRGITMHTRGKGRSEKDDMSRRPEVVWFDPLLCREVTTEVRKHLVYSVCQEGVMGRLAADHTPKRGAGRREDERIAPSSKPRFVGGFPNA